MADPRSRQISERLRDKSDGDTPRNPSFSQIWPNLKDVPEHDDILTGFELINAYGMAYAIRRARRPIQIYLTRRGRDIFERAYNRGLKVGYVMTRFQFFMLLCLATMEPCRHNTRFRKHLRENPGAAEYWKETLRDIEGSLSELSLSKG
jgi:hypothetical protein